LTDVELEDIADLQASGREDVAADGRKVEDPNGGGPSRRIEIERIA
jgi:hypothetical protein